MHCWLQPVCGGEETSSWTALATCACQSMPLCARCSFSLVWSCWSLLGGLQANFLWFLSSVWFPSKLEEWICRGCTQVSRCSTSISNKGTGKVLIHPASLAPVSLFSLNIKKKTHEYQLSITCQSGISEGIAIPKVCILRHKSYTFSFGNWFFFSNYGPGPMLCVDTAATVTLMIGRERVHPYCLSYTEKVPHPRHMQ